MYYLYYFIFYVLSKLPWVVIYFISDCLYYITYYIIGYRKKIVYTNLLIAFPEKTEKERIKIAKEFYHNLIDSFVETIKLFSISRKEFDKRCITNVEEINNLYSTGQSVQILSGHFFNSEFLNLSMSANLKYPFLGVFMSLSNKNLEKVIVIMRKKFGTILFPASEFRTEFPKYSNKLYSIGLIADQNPPNPMHAVWFPFFGRMVPFHTGPEKGAIKMNTAIALLNMYKLKRGYYKIEASILTTNPKEFKEGEITKQLAMFIENTVKKNPSNYLWSHRRFKYEFDVEKHGHLVI